MIIGKGSIANLVNNRDGFRFFAAGISDSEYDGNATDKKREFDLLKAEFDRANFFNEMFVYFSTISVFTKVSDYTHHKTNVEDCVRQLVKNYTIIRIGNLWECSNPNTFINKMLYWERQDKLLDSMIRDEYKFMINKEQLNFITDNLPVSGQHEISIFGEMLKVKDCLDFAKNMIHV